MDKAGECWQAQSSKARYESCSIDISQSRYSFTTRGTDTGLIVPVVTDSNRTHTCSSSWPWWTPSISIIIPSRALWRHANIQHRRIYPRLPKHEYRSRTCFGWIGCADARKVYKRLIHWKTELVLTRFKG